MMTLLDDYAKSMPEITAVIGMTAGATDLLGFIMPYLYVFISLVFPMMFCILRSKSLLAKYANSGAMSYLLAAPVHRHSIVFTQIGLLVSDIVLLGLEIGVAEHYFPGKLNLVSLLVVNSGLLCLHLFIGNICLVFSILFSDTCYSLTFGTGILTLMYVL